jgi:hypothetical protein
MSTTSVALALIRRRRPSPSAVAYADTERPISDADAYAVSRALANLAAKRGTRVLTAVFGIA